MLLCYVLIDWSQNMLEYLQTCQFRYPHPRLPLHNIFIPRIPTIKLRQPLNLTPPLNPRSPLRQHPTKICLLGYKNNAINYLC